MHQDIKRIYKAIEYLEKRIKVTKDERLKASYKLIVKEYRKILLRWYKRRKLFHWYKQKMQQKILRYKRDISEPSRNVEGEHSMSSSLRDMF